KSRNGRISAATHSRVLRCAKPLSLIAGIDWRSILTSSFHACAMRKTTTTPAVCQACGKKIVGDVFRFDDEPDSAFCSLDCQLEKTEITVEEIEFAPITSLRKRSRAEGDKSIATPKTGPRCVAPRVLADTSVEKTGAGNP